MRSRTFISGHVIVRVYCSNEHRKKSVIHFQRRDGGIFSRLTNPAATLPRPVYDPLAVSVIGDRSMP